jgi:hypothetical protein
MPFTLSKNTSATREGISQKRGARLQGPRRERLKTLVKMSDAQRVVIEKSRERLTALKVRL